MKTCTYATAATQFQKQVQKAQQMFCLVAHENMLICNCSNRISETCPAKLTSEHIALAHCVASQQTLIPPQLSLRSCFYAQQDVVTRGGQHITHISNQCGLLGKSLRRYGTSLCAQVFHALIAQHLLGHHCGAGHPAFRNKLHTSFFATC